MDLGKEEGLYSFGDLTVIGLWYEKVILCLSLVLLIAGLLFLFKLVGQNWFNQENVSLLYLDNSFYGSLFDPTFWIVLQGVLSFKTKLFDGIITAGLELWWERMLYCTIASMWYSVWLVHINFWVVWLNMKC